MQKHALSLSVCHTHTHTHTEVFLSFVNLSAMRYIWSHLK
uniref:Uncharacterized protein n=1 Tax=Anguilla anguilla TaxID=7936 RepID=A0A0E9SQU3_ANGAN